MARRPWQGGRGKEAMAARAEQEGHGSGGEGEEAVARRLCQRGRGGEAVVRTMAVRP